MDESPCMDPRRCETTRRQDRKMGDRSGDAECFVPARLYEAVAPARHADRGGWLSSEGWIASGEWPGFDSSGWKNFAPRLHGDGRPSRAAVTVSPEREPKSLEVQNSR